MITNAAMQALARRTLIGLMALDSAETEPSITKFWRASARTLINLSDGTADKLALRDARLASQHAQAGYLGAWARLTVGIEALTAVEVQQRFAAEGVQVTLDAATKFQVNAVEHFKHNEVAPVDGNEYVAALAILINDGAGLHGTSVSTEASC